jgi:glucose/arabinose dehydrogenase
MRRLCFAVAAVCWAAGFAVAAPPAIKLERVARGLKRPVLLTSDGGGRRFVVEQEGRIRLLEADGSLRPGAYLDIEGRVEDGGECGLLGLAFHPKFEENGYLYVNYTTKSPKLKTVIAEFREEPGAGRVDPKSERVLLTIDQPYANHNGGHVAFGPDGMLYIAVGDGGRANDPVNAGQDLGKLLGKVLRIDVAPREKYGVPGDNPFVGRSGARGEVWAWGLRNPWRFSFDRETGVCFAGDVGQNEWEEIDVVVKGGNYGWRPREGRHETPARRGERVRSEAIGPIAEYSHKAYRHAVFGKDTADLSVTGGYVYRGKRIPALVGWYLYGDYASGRIWGLRYEEGTVIEGPVLLMESRHSISSFGEDDEGEVYVVDHGGSVLRVVGE